MRRRSLIAFPDRGKHLFSVNSLASFAGSVPALSFLTHADPSGASPSWRLGAHALHFVAVRYADGLRPAPAPLRRSRTGERHAQRPEYRPPCMPFAHRFAGGGSLRSRRGGFLLAFTPIGIWGVNVANPLKWMPLRGERVKSPYPPAGEPPSPLPSPPPRGEGEAEGGRGEESRDCPTTFLPEFHNSFLHSIFVSF